MKVITVKRCDKDYVYLYTSRRVRGRKNPEVIKRYVGILDERTGLVTPKKVPPETFLALIHDGEFTCKELGNILVARKVAETLGIPERLDMTFDENSKIIYALVLAIAVNPLYSSDYIKYVSKYYLDDLVGKEALTAKDIDQALGDFQSRMRSAYFGTYERTRRLVFMLGSTSYGGGPIERVSHKGYARRVPERAIFIITDDEGNPLFLRSSASGMSASESLRKAATRANSTGGTNTFVLEALSPETMMAMVNGGVHFISDADHMLYDEDVFNGLTHDLADDWTIREYGSDSYHVLEAGLGIYREGNGLRTKIGRADGMSDALAVLRISAWFDQKKFEHLLKDITTVTNRRVDALKNMPLETARNHLMDGSMESQFISVSEGDDGGIRVKVQKKETQADGIGCQHPHHGQRPHTLGRGAPLPGDQEERGRPFQIPRRCGPEQEEMVWIQLLISRSCRHDDTHASGEDVQRIREEICIGGGDIPNRIDIHNCECERTSIQEQDDKGSGIDVRVPRDRRRGSHFCTVP